MSAAPGAPPPPPPHRPSFNDLPAELLLMLYDNIGMEEFINLALVIYPTLLRMRLVPELSPTTTTRIVADARVQDRNGRLDAPNRMPVELWLQVASYLEPANSLALIFALGPRFWRFPGTPSKELVSWLRVWSRRRITE
ncbi:hypothetical protein HBH98_014300 [Parastagonospora nodorum]|nr:hypothetical protein HBH52_080980 [Parastagonospora nodorum]KAH4007710.1 hypothetical protein HBI10_001370 [Parastagonospora nodorum]KAH4016522.1 hypothetical protein HBI13_149380 [Parastagonospora nodorum]KAH4198510.1 hypothetical protein HBH42_045280 [Parastagonospora nodorum]KAH4213900.1 hypothetical protein HBI95_000630 [Parastagonospora nodorum]